MANNWNIPAELEKEVKEWSADRGSGLAMPHCAMLWPKCVIARPDPEFLYAIFVEWALALYKNEN
mgnify:CR=1 FL=1